MSLDKAIEHGKEKRTPYYGSKAIDPSCRNHGSCPWCEENRTHKFRDKKPIEGKMSAYERGEWDMFCLITSAWHGKQYYFLEDNKIVYSRESGKYMSIQDAYNEFLEKVGDF